MSHHTLDSLRNAINQVDDDIILLLKKRMSLAKQVGQLKSNSQHSGEKSYLRPAREAAVIRKALANNQNDYPPEAIYAIWRQIMASCVHNEQVLTLLGYSPDGEELSRYLARAYFGEFPKLHIFNSVDEIVKTIQQNPTYIGILPLNVKGWWLPLKEAAAHQIRIFAALPFVTSQRGPAGVAITTIDLEPTEQDQTWCCITMTPNADATRLSQQIESAGGQLLEEDAPHYLAQLPGFNMTTNDSLWLRLQTENVEIQSVTPLGCHPLPIRIGQ